MAVALIASNRLERSDRIARVVPCHRAPQRTRDRANILIVDDRPDKLLVYRTLLEELDQNLVHGVVR